MMNIVTNQIFFRIDSSDVPLAVSADVIELSVCSCLCSIVFDEQIF
jgi:hypothetical protein